MGKDMRTFLDQVRKLGPEFYVETSREMSTDYEVQVLQQKLAKEDLDPVIFCPKMRGSKLPLVSNLCANYEVMGLAFGLDPKEVKKNKDLAFQQYRDKSRKRVPTKIIAKSAAPVKEVIIKGKDIDLAEIPITKAAILNSGKYIPVGQMMCKNPLTGIQNSGIYRHEVKGRNKLGAFIIPANHGAYNWRQHHEIKQPMDVAIFIGHHPLTSVASCWNGSIDVSELEIMGSFLGEPLEVVKGETVDLDIPAYAEMVIEGVCDTTRMYTDGPYSEWTGYYGPEHECYVIDVTAITMRKDAIYQDLDPSSWEHNFLCTIGAQNVAYEAVKALVPTVKSVAFARSGMGLINCYVSIKKRVPGEAKRAGWAAVNAYQSTNIAIVVDEDIDVYNEQEVMWAVATRCTADTGIDIVPNMLGGILVPTSYDESRQKRGVMNSKMVIDATMPVERPFATRITPPQDVWDRMNLADYIKGWKK